MARGLLFLLVIFLSIVGIGIFILVQRGATAGVNVPSEVARPISVNVTPVRYSSELEIQEQYSGLVMARRSSSLGFEAGGRIAEISADIGDQVAEGQVLARLDTRSLNARLQASEAQISEAHASLQLAQATLDRQAFLVERDLLSGQSFDEAQTQLDAATARLAAAEAQADTLRVQIELSRIRAPFSGVITQRLADEGAIAAPGQSLLSLVEAGVMEARIGVPSDVASRLIVGEAYPMETNGQSYDVTLRAITGVIETTGRTVSAIFDVPADQGISPGAVARLSMLQQIDQPGFWIPVSAMTEANRGLWSVYAVIDGDDGRKHIEKRLVDIIHSEADRAFVRGALQDGDLFVMEGLQRLVPGVAVTPVLYTDTSAES
tara:strand:+ start:27037 stop:28167 length:1131 start_codon:yes stop_codon:yes gene_type:complete